MPTESFGCLYEANPIAMIAEQAGGLATDGDQRILDIVPTEVHQRTPFVVGSQVEMERLSSRLARTTRFLLVATAHSEHGDSWRFEPLT